jgi:ABC-type sugar transport system ATPase subunit
LPVIQSHLAIYSGGRRGGSEASTADHVENADLPGDQSGKKVENQTMSEQNELILKVEGISKRFGGVQALLDVDFDIQYGEVHALVGENGAGKTTMINILGGVVQRDRGRVVFGGKEVNFQSPSESIAAGISIIHQELAMLPALNVIENVYMGRMPARFGRVLWDKAEKQTLQALDQVGLKIDPHALVNELTISQRQLIEIAKALSREASLLIMDEPNSSLSETETERLFEVIERLKKRGVAVLYVSHKIEEVLRISDRISVLRDGLYTGTLDKSEASTDKIVHLMVGRELHREAARDGRQIGAVRLEVNNLTSERFRNVSFDVRAGEIVGFAGLVGAGRSDVARAIFGADSYTAGQILLDGKAMRFRHPSQAISRGLAMVPEDRKLLSLFMDMPVLFNISIAELPRMSRFGVIDHPQTRRTANNFVEELNIRLAGLDNPVRSLSGGNQQKTTLARWLATNPKLLILDEPTHGVDVGAKAEIYRLMRGLSQEGISIILISSELPEILTMSDRVVVMHEGQVTAVLNHEECDEETIMMYATGVAKNNNATGATHEV